MPASASARVGVIRDAGRRLITARSIGAAADELSLALAVCGDCHESLGIRPLPSPIARPDVGGIVGNMLEHQRAMDELLQGVIIPSVSLWQASARRLLAAPLRRSELPDDRALTREIIAAESRVHDFANEAVSAATLERRAALYGRLLATCATCHGLHPRIWGPTTR